MKRRAIFFGVDDYAHISPLSGAVADATAMRDFFSRPEWGFSAELYANPRYDGEVTARVGQMREGMEAGDLLLVYFAGHGVEIRGAQRLLCAEASRLAVYRDANANAVELQSLEDAARGPQDTVFVIDACRVDIVREGVEAIDEFEKLKGKLAEQNISYQDVLSGRIKLRGFFGGLFTRAGARKRDLAFADDQGAQQTAAQQSGGTWRADRTAPGKVAKLFSCRSGTFSAEFGGRGLFTRALLEELGDSAARGFAAQVAEPLRERVNRRMAGLAREGGLSVDQRAQIIVDLPVEILPGKSEAGGDAPSPSPKPAPLPAEGRGFTCATGSIPMRWCPATTSGEWRRARGTDFFEMGSLKEETGRNPWLAWDGDVAEVRHRVRLSRGFWMGETEVTQRQWREIMGTTVVDMAAKALSDPTVYSFASQSAPGTFRRGTIRQRRGDVAPESVCYNKDANAPIYWVSWEDAMEFCRRLNDGERKAGRLPAGYAYRLPTEAEWEHACRAGTETTLPNGRPWELLGNMDAPALDGIAWYGGNSAVGWDGPGADVEGWRRSGCKMQHPVDGNAAMRRVDGKAPNPWGIRDMLGNVWEWCHDRMGPYPQGEARDPTGPLAGSCRVVRGGSWYSDAAECRPACRWRFEQGFRFWTIGFRVALGPELQR